LREFRSSGFEDELTANPRFTFITAILGFVVQEALFGKPIVDQTPFFFHPAAGLF
jgi:hypothetical protein